MDGLTVLCPFAMAGSKGRRLRPQVLSFGEVNDQAGDDPYLSTFLGHVDFTERTYTGGHSLRQPSTGAFLGQTDPGCELPRDPGGKPAPVEATGRGDIGWLNHLQPIRNLGSPPHTTYRFYIPTVAPP